MTLAQAGNEDLPEYLKYGALEVKILDALKEFYDQGIEYASLELLHSKVKYNKVITARQARELIGYGLTYNPKKGYSYVPAPQYTKRSSGSNDPKTAILLKYISDEFGITADKAWIRKDDLCCTVDKKPSDLKIGDVINLNSIKYVFTWSEILDIEYLDWYGYKKGAAYRVLTTRKKPPNRFFGVNENAYAKLTYDIKKLTLPAGII